MGLPISLAGIAPKEAGCPSMSPGAPLLVNACYLDRAPGTLKRRRSADRDVGEVNVLCLHWQRNEFRSSDF